MIEKLTDCTGRSPSVADIVCTKVVFSGTLAVLGELNTGALSLMTMALTFCAGAMLLYGLGRATVWKTRRASSGAM